MFEVDEAVEALYDDDDDDDDAWYPGRIATVIDDHHYNIFYDDGDFRECVPTSEIRRRPPHHGSEPEEDAPMTTDSMADILDNILADDDDDDPTVIVVDPVVDDGMDDIIDSILNPQTPAARCGQDDDDDDDYEDDYEEDADAGDSATSTLEAARAPAQSEEDSFNHVSLRANEVVNVEEEMVKVAEPAAKSPMLLEASPPSHPVWFDGAGSSSLARSKSAAAKEDGVPSRRPARRPQSANLAASKSASKLYSTRPVSASRRSRSHNVLQMFPDVGLDQSHPARGWDGIKRWLDEEYKLQEEAARIPIETFQCIGDEKSREGGERGVRPLSATTTRRSRPRSSSKPRPTGARFAVKPRNIKALEEGFDLRFRVAPASSNNSSRRRHR